MPNEEILTGLRNAIEHGEDLQSAMQIMINSGYNPIDVQEASKFVSGGTLTSQQPTPEEQLTMPEQKPSPISKLGKTIKPFSKITFWKKQPQQTQPQQTQQQSPQPRQQPTHQPQQLQQPMQFQQQRPIQLQPPPQLTQTLMQSQTQSQLSPQPQFPPQTQPLSQFQQTQPLTRQLEKIRPKEKSHFKEIILLLILMVLIGILVATILLRDAILGWFS